METILERLRKMNIEDLKTERSRAETGDEESKTVLRGIYRCRACGYIFNEEMEGKPFSTLTECPVCHVSPGGFMQIR